MVSACDAQKRLWQEHTENSNWPKAISIVLQKRLAFATRQIADIEKFA